MFSLLFHISTYESLLNFVGGGHKVLHNKHNDDHSSGSGISRVSIQGLFIRCRLDIYMKEKSWGASTVLIFMLPN